MFFFVCAVFLCLEQDNSDPGAGLRGGARRLRYPGQHRGGARARLDLPSHCPQGKIRLFTDLPI